MLALLALAAAAPPALTDATVAQVLPVVRPRAGEDIFERIPWRTDVWAARREAAAAGKPLLLWEMDGNPLGCG